MKQPLNAEELPELAGQLVKMSPESLEWFSLEGIFEGKFMLKEFDGHRLCVYIVGEVTLWLVEADELKAEMGLGVLEASAFSLKTQKKTGEPVLL